MTEDMRMVVAAVMARMMARLILVVMAFLAMCYCHNFCCCRETIVVFVKRSYNCSLVDRYTNRNGGNQLRTIEKPREAGE